MRKKFNIQSMTTDEFHSLSPENLANALMEARDDTHGFNRQVLLRIWMMDNEKLYRGCEEHPEAYFYGFKCTAQTLTRLKDIVQGMESGLDRLAGGLFRGTDWYEPDAPFTREQFYEVWNKAKAQYVAGGAS